MLGFRTFFLDGEVVHHRANLHTVKKFHNHENAANMQGEIQQALGVSDADFEELCNQCQDHAEAHVAANESAIQLYNQADQKPAIASGLDARDWVAGQMGQMGPVVVERRTRPGSERSLMPAWRRRRLPAA